MVGGTHAATPTIFTFCIVKNDINLFRYL
jgi:hypothetical protein